jgi:hypothetical protein
MGGTKGGSKEGWKGNANSKLQVDGLYDKKWKEGRKEGMTRNEMEGR